MKILVFVPTRLFGGLDVLHASMVNQDFPLRGHKVDLFVADELYYERYNEWSRVWPDPIVRKIGRPLGTMRNLCASYNAGLLHARENSYELMVSAQDYFWWPKDSISRFADLAKEEPNALYTGGASLYADPSSDRVMYPHGLYSVFDRFFDYDDDEPQEVSWYDCRAQTFSQPDTIYRVSPIEWETNFAAIGPGVLEDDIWFDEELDYGIAYENQDFAANAEKHGHMILYYSDIHVKGLPHKKYFPEIEAREAPYTEINRNIVQDKWGI